MKLWKKAVSVLLALVMTLSLATAAFAADGEKTYTPAYSDTLSEETVADLVADLDILIEKELWTKVVDPLFSNATIATVYGLYGMLAVDLKANMLNEAGSPPSSNYFRLLNPELFGNLPADVADVTKYKESEQAEEKNLLADIDYGVTNSDTFFDALGTALGPVLSALRSVYSLVDITSEIEKLIDPLQETMKGLGLTSLEPVAMQYAEDENGAPMWEVPVYQQNDKGRFVDTGSKKLVPVLIAEPSGKDQLVRPTRYNIDADGTFVKYDLQQTIYYYNDNPNTIIPVPVSELDGVYFADGAMRDAKGQMICERKFVMGSGLQFFPLTPSKDYLQFGKDLASYLGDLVAFLRQGTVTNVLHMLAQLGDEGNRISASALFNYLQEFFNGDFVGLLQGNIVQGALGDLAPVLNEVIRIAKEDLTYGKASDGSQTFDLVATLNKLCQEKLIPTEEVDEDGNVINKAIGLKLGEINWANLSPDMSAADTFMVVYHYLYSNLIGNRDNLNAVASLLTDLANLDISSYLGLIETLDSDALLATVAGMVSGIVHPAVSVEDPETGVTIDAESDKIVPADAALKVEQITSGEAYDKVADSLKDAEQFLLFDISLINNDLVEIQPNGTIKVKIPLPEGYDAAKVLVYRVEADGTLTDMKAVVEEGYLVFETDHLSLYAVAQMTDVVTPPGGDTNGDTTEEPSDPVDTGDAALSVAACVSLAAAVAFVITRRKHA